MPNTKGWWTHSVTICIWETRETYDYLFQNLLLYQTWNIWLSIL